MLQYKRKNLIEHKNRASRIFVCLPQKTVQALYKYLLCLSVWVTAVVNETRYVSFLCCVDDFIRIQCHEIMVHGVLSRILLRACLKLFVVEYFPNILHDKCATGIESKQYKRVHSKYRYILVLSNYISVFSLEQQLSSGYGYFRQKGLGKLAMNPGTNKKIVCVIKQSHKYS